MFIMSQSLLFQQSKVQMSQILMQVRMFMDTKSEQYEFVTSCTKLTMFCTTSNGNKLVLVTS